jgi:hypothetical protein
VLIRQRRGFSIALLIVGVVVLLFGAIGVVALGFDTGTTNASGLLVGREVRVMHSLDVGQSGNRSYIPGVRVQYDSGTTVMDSEALYKASANAALPVSITAEEDSAGALKRVYYESKWYGAGTPPAFLLIAFSAAIAAAGVAMVVVAARGLRAVR